MAVYRTLSDFAWNSREVYAPRLLEIAAGATAVGLTPGLKRGQDARGPWCGREPPGKGTPARSQLFGVRAFGRIFSISRTVLGTIAVLRRCATTVLR
jgi:hypothetical protein